MKKTYFENHVTLVGSTEGSVCLRHENEDTLSATFFFMPYLEIGRFSKERLCILCKAFGDLAIVMDEHKAEDIKISGRMVEYCIGISGYCWTQDVLLVEDVEIGDQIRKAARMNKAVCSGAVSLYDTPYPYEARSIAFLMQGIDWNGDPVRQYCRITKALSPEECVLLRSGRDIEVIGRLGPVQEYDPDYDGTEEYLRKNMELCIYVDKIREVAVHSEEDDEEYDDEEDCWL